MVGVAIVVVIDSFVRLSPQSYTVDGIASDV
jgi:hypothetical protein